MTEQKIYNEMLIKNVDAGTLYMAIKNDDDINKYEEVKKQVIEHEEGTDEYIKLCEEREKLSQKIFTFKDKDVIFPQADVRYRYTGTITDSLMSRKIRTLVADDPKAIRTVGDTDYTDLIINIKFKNDILIPDGKKKGVDKETGEVVELDGKKMKKLISKKKLRKMIYTEGITINGIHYVDYQRTSSKARTGNNLFIDERLFEVMEQWQTMGIPFRDMVRSEDRKNPNPFEEADIVSTRSYSSLISSSIIGTLDIDPYSILLIDDVSSEYTMPCNVIDIVEDENGKHLAAERRDYTQNTDLWDGHSLVDRSVFENGRYFQKNKEGQIESHSYTDKGFMLLRNHFFKTAIFNTNLQDYYKDRYKGVADPKLEDKFGNKFEPQNILMVTTKNSVKIFKFADMICTYLIDESKKDHLRELEAPMNEASDRLKELRQAVSNARRKNTLIANSIGKKEDKYTKDDFLDSIKGIAYAEQYLLDNEALLEETIKKCQKPVKFEQERLTWDWYREYIKTNEEKFGVCKYEKTSKFGDKQQIWYQVLISMNLNKEQLRTLVIPQTDEVNLEKQHVAFFKRGLDLRATNKVGESMMYQLLNVNDNVSRTKWYTDYRRSQLNSVIKKLKEGKIQIENSDFRVLVSNPYEMLRASCGDKITDSILHDFECWCPRFKDNEEIYGFRSPHICQGNCAVLKNVNRPEWKWFNFTENIAVINCWGKGAFISPTWNGCDTDSDVSFIGNEPIILEAARESAKQLVPINGLSPQAKMMEYTEENMATVDGQLCNDFIGKICNLARDLQCLYWHLYNTGTEVNKKKYLNMIYDDICILEVLSNIAIDSAKRRYDVNIASEIKRMKNRPYMKVEGAIISDEKILIEETRYKKSLSEATIKNYEELVERRKNAKTEEEVIAITKEIDNELKKTETHMIRPQFTRNLKAAPKKRKRIKFDNENQKRLYQEKQKAYTQEQRTLKDRIYHKLENPMDMLAEVIDEEIIHAPRTKFITFCEILNPIPKGKEADVNRVKAIKQIGLDGIKRINKLQNEFDSNRLSFDDFYERKQNEITNIINDMKYTDKNGNNLRKIETWDIHRLLRDVYDTHPKKDTHGKIVMDKDTGKPVIIDKRDKDLAKAQVGGLLIQWVYAAFPEKFLATIRSNKGVVSYVKEITTEDKPKTERVTSLKDLKSLANAPQEEVYKLDGHEYIIVKKDLRKGSQKPTRTSKTA